MLVQISNVAAPVAGARHVERLAQGVVSVAWTVATAAESFPIVHLHVGDGTRPPVDVTFDGRDGRLLGVQVVLQDDAVSAQHLFGDRLPGEPGLPVADVGPWRDEEQILDHVFRPVIAWEPTAALSVRIARTSGLPSKEYVVDGLAVVADERDLLLGFRVCGLDQDEMAVIDEETARAERSPL